MGEKHGRSIASGSLSSHSLAVLALLLSARAINALAVRTFFQPDEYFQSLEPAWRTAFGSESGAWMTWEWREGLRSSLHPLLFAGVYRAAAHIGDALGLSTAMRSELLIAAPKLLQAGFAAAMDFYTYMLATKIYGYKSGAAYAALFLTLLSPWQAFCSVRTLSNSVETTLTIIALYLWPWRWFVMPFGSVRTAADLTRKDHESSTSSAAHSPPLELYQSLAAAALACILRPTNIIIWATVAVSLVIRYAKFPKIVGLAQGAIMSGGAVLTISVSADRAFYDAWILPPLRFLQFNLVQSLAVFYGRNRPDYYFTEGLPLLLTTALPFAAVGIWQSSRRGYHRLTAEGSGNTVKFTLAMAVVTSVFALSLISHKEMRFIYPLLPMLHVLAAEPMAKFFTPFPWPRRNLKRATLFLMIAVNVFIGWYTLFVHQRGVIDVLHHLRRQHEETKLLGRHQSGIDITTVGFLMPCHSTPWRSHLVHPTIYAWALTCEPPLNLTMAERQTYMDEADVFYDDPAAWVASNMGDDRAQRRAWPNYLVFFQQLEAQLTLILENDQYVEDWRGFNTHWHDDSRRKGDVIVWRRASL